MKGLQSTPETDLIESINSMTNMIVTGAKKEIDFFEFFCEADIVELMKYILENSRSSAISMQVVSSLTLYLYNFKEPTYIYYLLSNKDFHEIISMDLSFKDNELTDYWVNFLKCIASKIKEHPVDLFYNNIYSHFPI